MGRLLRFSLFCPTVVLATPAYCVQYLSIDEAQQLLFPNGRFTSVTISSDTDIEDRLESLAGFKVDTSRTKLWRVSVGGDLSGYFFVDEVIGKHEYITYAVAISTSGAVIGIEILDYREQHGSQVRDRSWRDQFEGRTIHDPVAVGQDIKNISGATLSSKHVTEGVRRLLAIYEVELKKA